MRFDEMNFVIVRRCNGGVEVGSQRWSRLLHGVSQGERRKS
jgi:hypothetical protein